MKFSAAAVSESGAGARVIAEIGGNHRGEIETAKEMIKMAKIFCNAYAVKFQKRNPRECLTEQEYNSPHPVPQNAYGRTYGEHRERLEFSFTQHRELKEYCDELGILYSCSVWDLSSARELVSLSPAFLKLPSACNTHFELLDFLCGHFEGGIHVSLGMTTREEEASIVRFFEQRGRAGDLVLYACTSGYPVADTDVCLLEIERLQNTYGSRVHSLGFSGHHLGIAIDVAAMVLGATWIERHFTLDRTWKGTDHAASLEPDGLRRVVRDVASVARALTLKPAEILEVEIAQRKKLKWDRHNTANDWAPDAWLANGTESPSESSNKRVANE